MVPEESEDNAREINRHKLEAQFIGECLINVYERTRAKKLCRENKGKHFLQMTTASPPHTKLVLLGKAALYDEEILFMTGLALEDLQLYIKFEKRIWCFGMEARER